MTDFSNQIYNYISKQYDKKILSAVRSEKNKHIVHKLVESSQRQNDNIEHAANKIIAMLRLHS